MEVLGGLVRRAIEIHLDAVDDREESVARDRKVTNGGRQASGDGMMRGFRVLVAAEDVGAPLAERAASFRLRPVVEVRDVVHGPAKRVDRVERFALLSRERQERVVEVRAAPARESRAELGWALHAVAAE